MDLNKGFGNISFRAIRNLRLTENIQSLEIVTKVMYIFRVKCSLIIDTEQLINHWKGKIYTKFNV